MAWESEMEGTATLLRHDRLPQRLRGRMHAVAFLLSAVLMSGSMAPHDFHVSITQIDHNPQTQSLEITLRIFTDDLEHTMRSLGGGELRLGEPRESPDANRLLLEYFQNRLAIRVNDQPSVLEWVGKEIEPDATWCYLEVFKVPVISSLQITNRVLMEAFDDQKNIIHLNASGQTRSLFLNKREATGRLM
ncbi:MAG: hypothetical protein RLZZ165_1582 [Bacteroidota bacterium]|jgi:hypothetical protein